MRDESVSRLPCVSYPPILIPFPSRRRGPTKNDHSRHSRRNRPTATAAQTRARRRRRPRPRPRRVGRLRPVRAAPHLPARLRPRRGGAPGDGDGALLLRPPAAAPLHADVGAPAHAVPPAALALERRRLPGRARRLRLQGRPLARRLRARAPEPRQLLPLDPRSLRHRLRPRTRRAPRTRMVDRPPRARAPRARRPRPRPGRARLRAEAMEIRDRQAEQGGVTEEDWKRIDELLHQSWRSLWGAVNS